MSRKTRLPPSEYKCPLCGVDVKGIKYLHGHLCTHHMPPRDPRSRTRGASADPGSPWIIRELGFGEQECICGYVCGGKAMSGHIARLRDPKMHFTEAALARLAGTTLRESWKRSKQS
jgi:hypothetical protein